jgi:hypothetical protein
MDYSMAYFCHPTWFWCIMIYIYIQQPFHGLNHSFTIHWQLMIFWWSIQLIDDLFIDSLTKWWSIDDLFLLDSLSLWRPPAAEQVSSTTATRQGKVQKELEDREFQTNMVIDKKFYVIHIYIYHILRYPIEIENYLKYNI